VEGFERFATLIVAFLILFCKRRPEKRDRHKSSRGAG
jgi:hypothetical protein